jgi:Listeria/Bacterioides repeat
VTFDSNGGSAITPVTNIAEGATVTEPSAPSKTGYTFDGWYEQPDFSDTAWNFVTDKMPAKDVTLYAKWTVNSYTVTFDSKGGDAVPSAAVTYGNTVAKPSDPAKDDATPNVTAAGDASAHDFILKGWYTDEALTTPFDFDTPITADITLYAKWGLPIAELAGHDDGTLGTQFDRVWLSNSWWRILKADMDADPSNANQALILKEQVLTDTETGDGNVLVQFDTTGTNLYFHDDTTSTGYGESHLKDVIDRYYNMAIAPTYSNYVLPVDLDLPNWSRYQNAAHIPSDVNLPMSYENWHWNSWWSHYVDNRFATSLTPLTTLKQQAFALSYGDIQSLDKRMFFDDNPYHNPNIDTSLPNPAGRYSALLAFESIGNPCFWLRSPSNSYSTASAVNYGCFDYDNSVNVSLPVRPALAIQLD